MTALIFMLVMFLSMIAYSIQCDYRKERVYTYERTEWAKEREHYKHERQQLLDRIQAPTFAEYKQQEVRVIKAQSNEKEQPKLEQL